MYNPLDFKMKRSTITQLICPVACFVSAVVVCCMDSNLASLTLVNGFSGTGEYLLSIQSSNRLSHSINFNIPLYFNKGLYVIKGSKVSSYSIQFKPCQYEDMDNN